VERLALELRGVPEALGDVILLNMGKGSQTSDWGRDNAFTISQKRPKFVLSEDFTINDCFEPTPGNPQVTEANQHANMLSMHNEWVAAGIDVTWQSMSAVGPLVAVGRPTLAARYASGLTYGLGLGDRVLGNYLGDHGLTIPPGVAGGWLKPLPGYQTNGAVPFALPVTAGYGPQSDLATWDPAHTGAAVSLSGDLLTATGVGGTGMTRSTVAIAGKIHFETTAGAGGTYNIGLTNAAGANGGYPGLDGNSIGLSNGAGVYSNGLFVGPSGLPGVNPGDTIGYEVDPVAHLIYFMQGAIRSAGFDISGLGGGSLYPALGVVGAGQGATFNPNQTGDQLHPLQVLTDQYLLPNAKFWCRQRMAQLYGLPAPTYP
jgi:hypothetical protein